MKLPREVLKRDGVTLEAFFVQKAVMRRVEVRRKEPAPVVRAAIEWARTATPLRMLEGFTEDRSYVWLKILLIILAFLAASWAVIR